MKSVKVAEWKLIWGYNINIRYTESNRNQAPKQTETQSNPFKKMEHFFLPRVSNSLPKYPRDMNSGKTEKFLFEFDIFIELIPVEHRMPN